MTNVPIVWNKNKNSIKRDNNWNENMTLFHVQFKLSTKIHHYGIQYNSRKESSEFDGKIIMKP